MKQMLHKIIFGATFEMRLAGRIAEGRCWKIAAARHRCSKSSPLKSGILVL
ncbi:hypothetical protein [Bradyrhizobium sp. LMTR 3]|uniref:hypothetical protein n=1 Tax=Bradyrhizobium sp. LMTR 3 TaxID=189873 RepID=UPI00159F2A42|nr:hypothetical protein [Bradyrhizobium sp. LMTR 3]